MPNIPLREILKIAGTVLMLLLTPIWLPICFLVYEVNWKGMWADLQRFHEILWK